MHPACSLVALGHKVSAVHIGKMIESMCNKLVAPRSKKDHSDSIFIGLKAFLSEVPAAHGSLVAGTATPILGSGIKEQAESVCCGLFSLRWRCL